MQTVDRFRGNRQRSIEPKRLVGCLKIVVDGFRNADDVHPHLAKLVRDVHRSVAADGDKTIQPPTFVMLQRACRGVDNFDSFVSFGRVVERVSFVGGTEDCPP